MPSGTSEKVDCLDNYVNNVLDGNSDGEIEAVIGIETLNNFYGFESNEPSIMSSLNRIMNLNTFLRYESETNISICWNPDVNLLMPKRNQNLSVDKRTNANGKRCVTPNTVPKRQRRQ